MSVTDIAAYFQAGHPFRSHPLLKIETIPTLSAVTHGERASGLLKVKWLVRESLCFFFFGALRWNSKFRTESDAVGGTLMLRFLRFSLLDFARMIFPRPRLVTVVMCRIRFNLNPTSRHTSQNLGDST